MYNEKGDRQRSSRAGTSQRNTRSRDEQRENVDNAAHAYRNRRSARSAETISRGAHRTKIDRNNDDTFDEHVRRSNEAYLGHVEQRRRSRADRGTNTREPEDYGILGGWDMGSRVNLHFIVPVVVAVVVVILALVFGLRACSSPQTSDVASGSAVSDNAAGPVAAEELLKATYGGSLSSYSSTTFDSTAADTSVRADNVLPGASWSLTQEDLSSMVTATNAIYDDGNNVSYVMLDVDSGLLLSCNADYLRYTASSFKAVFSVYVMEDLVDKGEVSLDDIVTGYDSSSGFFSGTVEEAVESTILYSDNSAYDALRQSYADSTHFADFEQWLEECGLASAEATECAGDTWYPNITAKDMARLWLHMAQYLKGTTEPAVKLSGYLSETEVSPIRETLGGTGTTVLAKAGWLTNDYDIEDTICEGGLVDSPDGRYLIVYFTSKPYDIGEKPEDTPMVSALLTSFVDLRNKIHAA